MIITMTWLKRRQLTRNCAVFELPPYGQPFWRNIRGLNDAASSDRSSASDRITASVDADLPGVGRAILTAPREAERTQRACGIRTP